MYLPAGTTEWLGATPLWQNNEVRGTNFAFYTSAVATRVELCLFDKAQGAHETDHLDFAPKNKVPVLGDDGQTVTGYIWHGFAAGVTEGKFYGFRVDGPGFDPNKLQMDPEAKAVTGDPIPDPRPAGKNNGDIMPKAIVKNWQALPPGHTQLLGATLDKEKGGTNFAFYTAKEGVDGVELCLFDQAKGAQETRRVELNAKEEVKGNDGETTIGYIWHGFAKGVEEGQLYGFRVHGEYAPEKGRYFNPYKLLIDPCAKAVTHEIHDWDLHHFAQDRFRKVNNRFDMNRADNAAFMPKARVVDCQALYRKAKAAAPVGAIYPHADTNLLEMHVKGATIKHPEISENERGKYKALASDAFINWVKDMGYTSLEWMPIESFGSDTGLVDRAKRVGHPLKNYWGYMTMASMAPHTEYAATERPEEEVVDTVGKLKREGIEVIMDVVPNHTLEGGPGGPLLNLRGMDNSLYLPYDYTGTGNTRDFGHPINRRMFLEELRHWQEMGVSGFRIDLATIIGREHGSEFNPNSAMLKALRQDYGADHGLKNIKFYGEPWDLGPHPNNVQTGRLAHYAQDEAGLFGANFGNRVSEWNGDARDDFQRLLNSRNELTRGAIIERIGGSHRTYPDPQASVNKFASHDGGRLGDMTRREVKNNAANGEENRDGNALPGTNWGPEAPRVQRFLMALLGISQGVPMTCLGDDRDKSQDGNTNAYCQDNEISYIPWGDEITPEGRALQDFQRQINQFRKKHTALRRATHFSGKADEESGFLFNGQTMKDVTWLGTDGREIGGKVMDEAGGFGMLLSGNPGNSRPAEQHFTRLVQRQGRDTPLLVLFNPTMRDNMEFTLPNVPGVKWRNAIDTRDPQAEKKEIPAGQQIRLGWRSLMVLEGQRYLEQGTQARVSASR